MLYKLAVRCPSWCSSESKNGIGPFVPFLTLVELWIADFFSAMALTWQLAIVRLFAWVEAP